MITTSEIIVQAPGDSPLPDGGDPMIDLTDLSVRYPGRLALDGVSLQIGRGESFGLLGPNGSGKSTLMRVLAGLLAPNGGKAQLDGLQVGRDTAGVRRRLGVAFQAPSLDNKLSVRENLRFQGLLFGIAGRRLRERVDQMLESFHLTDRANDRVEILSGGLKRRVELAKTLLHKPPVLLLDEPSTGLDPAARQDFWSVLEKHRGQEELTIVLATHLMDEAERCHRVALLDNGRVVVVDRPETLRSDLGRDVVTMETHDPKALAELVREKLQLESAVNGGTLRMETTEGMKLIPRLMETFPEYISAVRLGKPTLEDVFLARTGRQLTGAEGEGA